MYKKYLTLLLGLLFLNSVSLEPIYHELLEHESSKIECQLCKNDASNSIESILDLDEVILPNDLQVEKIDDFVSFNFKNFYSRAPPK